MITTPLAISLEGKLIADAICELGNLIYTQEEKSIRRFEEAGIRYPNPDFNPKNVFVQFESEDRTLWTVDRISTIWLIDQASSEGSPTYEAFRRNGSSGILFEKRGWALD